MRTVTFRSAVAALIVMLSVPSVTLGGITRIVVIRDYAYNPAQITIEAGDTVAWINGGTEREPHNVVADDGSFGSGGPRVSGSFAFTFTQAGYYPYRCTVHPGEHLGGAVIVEGTVGTPFAIDPGHSGNWWNGPSRNGEGAQIEVADGGGGELVFVATIYSYGPAGGQVFLIAVGTPDGDSVDVELFITEGGVWGDGFDPADIVETQWGAGTFTAESCDSIHMSVSPNPVYQTEGYAALEYDLVRLTTPSVACPYEQ